MSETISARFCPHCLAPIRAEDRVCPACGQSVIETQESISAIAGVDAQAASVPQPTHLPGVYDPRLSVRLTPAQSPQGAARSRKLLVAVILLAILPLVLPFPFYGLAGLLIFQDLPPCPDFTCQVWTDANRLRDLLGLGPSFLVTAVSLLLGTIGLIRTHWRPTSQKNISLLWISVAWGAVWMILLGCIFWVLYFLDSIHD